MNEQTRLRARWPYGPHPDWHYVGPTRWRVPVGWAPSTEGAGRSPFTAHGVNEISPVALNPQPLPPGAQVVRAVVSLLTYRQVTNMVPDSKMRELLLAEIDQSLNQILIDCGNDQRWWQPPVPPPDPIHIVADLAWVAAETPDESLRAGIRSFGAQLLQQTTAP